MTIDYASIGLRIKHERTKQGLSQEQLAEAAQTSRTHISNIEIGDVGISLELLIAIANALHVPIGELLIDNLTGSDSSSDNDLNYILLDCNNQEEKIITKTAKALKAILLENGI